MGKGEEEGHRRTVVCCWSLPNAESLLPFCCTRHSAFLLALFGICAEWWCRHPSQLEEPGCLCCSGQTSPDVCALKGQYAPWKLNTVHL